MPKPKYTLTAGSPNSTTGSDYFQSKTVLKSGGATPKPLNKKGELKSINNQLKSTMNLKSTNNLSLKSSNNFKSTTMLNGGARRKSRQINAETASKDMAANRIQMNARLRKSGLKDWNSLKRDIIQSLNFRMTSTFIKILQSKELDKMLLLAVEYGKWFVHLYLLQKQQEQSSSSRLRELPEHIVSIFLPVESSSIENELLESLTIESNTSLEQARQKSRTILKEFGRAYCFLLLYAGIGHMCL
jgi:hypothetical protein